MPIRRTNAPAKGSGIRSVIRPPLIAPAAKPVARPASTAAIQPHPAATHAAVMHAESAIIEPTERSRPAPRITNPSPHARIPMNAAFCPTADRLLDSRKAGTVSASAPLIMRISPRVGSSLGIFIRCVMVQGVSRAGIWPMAASLTPRPPLPPVRACPHPYGRGGRGGEEPFEVMGYVVTTSPPYPLGDRRRI